jgi:hypothetical protein
MGLSLENFDGDGGYRTQENGVAIDTSGALDGVNFTDAAGLGKALHDNPATSSCVVNRLASYAIGRPVENDTPWAQTLTKDFGAKGYRLTDLMREVALSDDFYKVTPPDAAPTKAAANPAPHSASR